MSDHKVILSPRSKERALYMLEQNKLEFYVYRTATKHDVRGAVRSLFQVEVSKVNTRITKEGKLAIVKLAERSTANPLSHKTQGAESTQIYPLKERLASQI